MSGAKIPLAAFLHTLSLLDHGSTDTQNLSREMNEH
jgi:hypothetical protein